MIYECTSLPVSKQNSCIFLLSAPTWNLKVMITTETILSSPGVQMCSCTVQQNILQETEIYQWYFILPFLYQLFAIQRKWYSYYIGLGTQLRSMLSVWGLYIAHEQPASLKGWFVQTGHLPLSVIFGGNKYELLYVQLQAIFSQWGCTGGLINSLVDTAHKPNIDARHYVEVLV